MNVDYVGYNVEGKIQYQLLITNPKLFFTDLSHDIQAYGFGGLFESKYSFWAYLRFNLLFKFLAVLDLITRGNFYLNSMIFCSLTFFGHIAFYRIYNEIYPGHKLKILLVCFFIPSLLVYTSCVHKDGIVFLSVGIVSFIFYTFLKKPGSINTKMILFLLLGTVTIFLFRNYVFIALVPAILTALLSKLLPFRKRIVFALSYFFFFLLFFLSGYTNIFLNLPAAVVQRRADFALLTGGNTNIPMNDLYPNLKSFIWNAPEAISHYLFRPYLGEFSKPAVFSAALELFIYQLIFIAFIFFRKKKSIITNSFNLFGFAFFVNMMLIIGYTIPNIGAIVRYRSIFWVFIICPLICNTDWKRMFSFIKPLPI